MHGIWMQDIWKQGIWRKVLGALLVMAVASCGLAQGRRTVAVYPFASQDVLVGVAVADRIATALGSELEVLGPAVTPAFVPLLITKDGYVPPLNLLDDGGQVGSRTGAGLLRSVLGVDAVLSGDIDFGENGLELRLQLAREDAVATFRISAPEDQPGVLAEKALVLVAGQLGISRPHADTAIDLSGPYGDYVGALALLTGGFVPDARAALERALESDEASAQERARWSAILENLKALPQGEPGSLPAVQAAAALNLTPFDPGAAARYMEALPDYPFRAVWLATLAASRDEQAEAAAAFDRAARYPFGRAARAMYRAVQGGGGALEDLQELKPTQDLGGMLAASLAAKELGEAELEKGFLTRLTKLAPTFVYPFERLSFIAFDEERPLAAGEALAVAVRLAPDSDLYWTNFGWAAYLLGLFDQSEAASERAIALDAGQHIAWFNLGLVRAVTGRLDEAMAAYKQAVTLDPEVDDEAVGDLENALALHPEEPGLHFALATLYEQEGRREDAAGQFAAYLSQAPGGPYVQEARQRIAFLQAPPPPIAITDEVVLVLGQEMPATSSFHPGDRVHPSYELSTPGFELPGEVQVALRLEGADGQAVEGAAVSQQLRVPDNAVAMVIDEPALDLPADLPPGSYRLVVIVSAEQGRQARAEAELDVSGGPSLARALFSRDIELRSVDTGAPLLRAEDMSADNSERRLVEKLLSELRATAPSAGEVLPAVTQGRFQGLGGEELFEESSAEDVQDFLGYLLSRSGGGGQAFTFVDAYAQWALEGAPEE